MERKITQVEFIVPKRIQTKRVAAYARVSSEKDAMLHSLSAQVSYYSQLIQNHKGWLYCGIYSDEAKTGTKDTRNGFQRLMADCRAGKIDMIITKSISRFARNTVTLLQTVRELKNIGVDVYFEEQNIHTMSNDGELLMTILASYAQEESRSASENQKWRIKKNFQEGIPWNQVFYGYHFENGRFVIVPEEAKVIKLICEYYLSGMGLIAIEKKLNEQGFRKRSGKKWGTSSINDILTNYNYTGNLILQKTYRQDYITKKKLINNGELPKYHVEYSHEAIIPIELFEKIQEERNRRTKINNRQRSGLYFMPFSGKVFCGLCGKGYKRKKTATGYVWICSTFNKYGKSQCPSKQIPEATLVNIINDVTDDCENIERIEILPKNLVKIMLKNGHTEERVWKDRSRSESWTAEKREAARQKAIERMRK